MTKPQGVFSKSVSYLKRLDLLQAIFWSSQRKLSCRVAFYDTNFKEKPYLPQVSSENLNEGNLQGWDFAVHENSCQIELDLETNVDISPIDGWRPPKGKSSIGNLVQTGSLCVGQLFVLHGFFETGCFFPEKTFPCGEIGSLKNREKQSIQTRKDFKKKFTFNNTK